MMRYLLSDIAVICGGRLTGEDLPVEHISTDSRTGMADDRTLFVAMRGAHHDSHEFVDEMARRGVRAFLTERKVKLPAGCGQVVVKNAIDALQGWAAHHRAQFGGVVVAIAGSAGKTVVKEWIARQIPEGIKVFRSPRSYNSQLGVALSLLMIEGSEQLALIEAGISQPGEMTRLERMIRPEVVVFTSLGAAHQAHFASLEEKAAEKLLLAKNAETIIYHGETALLKRMIEKVYHKKRLFDAVEYPLPEPLPVPLQSETGRIDAQLVGAFCEAMDFPAPDFNAMQPLERQSHTTVLEVSLDAMTHNLAYFRAKLRPDVGVLAMVKASSYGAGDVEVAQWLQQQGVKYLAVAFADEGVLLRERGITMPIVVLNADEDSFDGMVARRLEPEIYSFRSLEAFAAAVESAGETGYPVHIKLDTGMHRLGFMEEEMERLGERLRTCSRVKAATVFSHLSRADMPEQDDFTRIQLALFERMSNRLMAAVPYPMLRHVANSAAIDRFPEAQFDLVRLGIGLYGFGAQQKDQLKPVSTLKTSIVQIKRLAKDESVGYGCDGKLHRDSVIATLPVGYADGLDRHLGDGRWSMRVAGHPAPTVGRICMDSCMIDITEIPHVEEGAEAVIFSPAAGHTAEDMARVLDTIPYEVLTSVSGRVKRIYVKE